MVDALVEFILKYIDNFSCNERKKGIITISYKKEKWCASPETTESRAEKDNLKGSGGHQGEVEVWRLALDLALVLPLPLGHVLQVEDCTTLRMVKAGCYPDKKIAYYLFLYQLTLLDHLDLGLKLLGAYL
jgi:hypothetical protein